MPQLVPNDAAPTDNDHALIAGLCAGDDRAFLEAIKRFQSLMIVVARGLVGDAFADDVVQESWLAIYKNIHRFEKRSSLKTWILTITSNQAKTRLRKEARSVSIDMLDGKTPGSYLDSTHFKQDGHWDMAIPIWRSESPDELIQEKQLRTCINKTLQTLPPQQKAVFLLRELEEESFEHIAELLNLSAANVRVLLHRARLVFMQMLDRYQETGSC